MMVAMNLLNVTLLMNAEAELDTLREDVLEFEPTCTRDVDAWDSKRVEVDKRIRRVRALISEALRGN